jgi:dolichol-phosphate mannosyltransferase
MDKILIIIPTYNENNNIDILIKNIFNKSLELNILIVDDNSTDGTLEKIRELKKIYKNLFLLKRPKKMGVGSAHIDGIKWAYKNYYPRVITMDGDLTHSTDKIDDFIEKGKNFDLVIGSRFLDKNSLKDWDLHRKALTHLGHFCTKFLLGIKYDASGGFRFYKLNTIPIEIFGKISSKGYSFFMESIFFIQRHNFSISEIELKLPKRMYGSSKMTIYDIIKSLLTLQKLILVRIFSKKIK